jgi:hypothetical protein
MKTLSRTVLATTAAVAMATLGGDCDGDVIQDPTFRDWCNGTLCAWSLDSGHIEQVPTWSTTDLGVSFLDQGTEISQSTGENAALCLLFTTTADLDPAAQMVLLVDYDSDGTIDVTQPLGATEWHRVQTELSTPLGYSGITFHLQKQGPASATAILAEMRIQSTTGCQPAGPLAPAGLAGTCRQSSDCGAGLFCDPASSVCAQCSDSVACPGAVACETRLSYFPEQCAPGQRLGSSGAPCVFDDDCASGTCGGASLFNLALLVPDAGTMTVPPGTDPMTFCQLPPEECATIDAGEPCGCTVIHGGTCQ